MAPQPTSGSVLGPGPETTYRRPTEWDRNFDRWFFAAEERAAGSVAAEEERRASGPDKVRREL